MLALCVSSDRQHLLTLSYSSPGLHQPPPPETDTDQTILPIYQINMAASLPGNRELPESQYDLSTYWGRVRQTAGLTDPR